jgi:nicotinamidase-related amidase
MLLRRIQGQENRFMSVSSTDKGLLTPENCVVVFIDHQSQMFLGGIRIDRKDLLKNALLLAKAARMFCVPVIFTAIESNGFSGKIASQLLDLFPGETPIERSSMNAWDDRRFVEAVRNTGRRNFLIAALLSEACLVFPALQMLEEGYGVYAVENACGSAEQAAHRAAIRRIEQAGAVSLTALQVLLEFQRDWAKKEHCEEVMAMVKEHCGVCRGPGDERTGTVRKGRSIRKQRE